MIFKAIESSGKRGSLLRGIIARILGVLWSVASVFVIPIIVRDQETVNPISILKKSVGIIRQTWGESLIGYIGIGAINTIVMVGALVFIGGAVFVSTQLHNFWFLGLAIAVWLVSIMIWSYLMNVAGLDYKGALYLYAAEGVVADPYDQEMLDSAWKLKRA